MLQVCLNGARTGAVPLTPDELAVAARAAVAAGATDIHLHPKSPSGYDTLAAAAVAAAVAAVRSAVAGVTVGVTTGAWTASTVERVAQIRMWTVLPDHASVNWHEEGAEEVATALLARGVAVHAGIFSGTSAAAALRRSPLLPRVSRILAEVVPPALDVDALLASLAGLEPPVLLHGEDGAAWPVLRRAQALGLDTRIGFEDTLTCPTVRRPPPTQHLSKRLSTGADPCTTTVDQPPSRSACFVHRQMRTSGEEPAPPGSGSSMARSSVRGTTALSSDTH